MVSPEILRRYPCFSGLAESSLKQLAMMSEEKSVPAGAVIFHEDEEAAHLYIVTEGEVNIQYVLGNGDHQTVDTLVAGDLMVWSSVVEPHRTHSVGAARTAVKLVAVDAPKLRLLMEQDPILGHQLMQAVAREIAQRLHGARLQLAAM